MARELFQRQKEVLMFESILKLSADTPQRLRRCDVFRVIDAANNAGCLAGFKEWLLARRLT
jgi:hypothetical protein